MTYSMSDSISELEAAMASGNYEVALDLARSASRRCGGDVYVAYLALHLANMVDSCDRVSIAEALQRLVSRDPAPSPFHLDALVRAWYETGFDQRAAAACQTMFARGVFPVSVAGTVVHEIVRSGVAPCAIHELLMSTLLEASNETMMLELLRDYDEERSIKVAKHRNDGRLLRNVKRGLLTANSDATVTVLREADWIALDNPFRDAEISSAAFVRTNPLGIAVFTQAIVTGGSSVVELSDHSIYCEYLDDWRWSQFSSWPDARVVVATKHTAVLEPLNMEPMELPEGVVLTGPMMNEFGHLLADTLPRLESLEDLDPTIPLIITAGSGYAREWFLRVIGERPLLEIPRGQSLILQQAYLPVGRVPIPPHLRRWDWYDPSLSMPTVEGATFLRRKLRGQAAATVSVPNRIILDRHKFTQHTMSNEKGLHELVNRFGFVPVDPADLSIPQQIALFAGVDQVVGNYGSAFLNLQWSQPGTRALGLVPNALSSWAVGQSTYLQANSAHLDLFLGTGGNGDAMHGVFAANLEEVEEWLER